MYILPLSTPTRPQAWLLTTRPKTLTVALCSALVGNTLAYQHQQSINPILAICSTLVALLIQIATNFINDAYDFEKGADSPTRKGTYRGIHLGILQSSEVLKVGFLLLALAFLFSIPLILQAGWTIGLLILLSIYLAYGYTGGPFPLAYNGLGDLFAFLFFGLASTGAIYFIQTGELTPPALLAGAQLGSLATSLVAINNLRDYQEDQRVQKKTLSVLFGKTFSRIEITFLLLFPYCAGFFWVYYSFFFAFLLPLLTSFLLFPILLGLWTQEPSPSYNKYLAQIALLHLLFSLFLTSGFLFS